MRRGTAVIRPPPGDHTRRGDGAPRYWSHPPSVLFMHHHARVRRHRESRPMRSRPGHAQGGRGGEKGGCRAVPSSRRSQRGGKARYPARRRMCPRARAARGASAFSLAVTLAVCCAAAQERASARVTMTKMTTPTMEMARTSRSNHRRSPSPMRACFSHRCLQTSRVAVQGRHRENELTRATRDCPAGRS